MSVHAVNTNDVPLEKSGQGHTRRLMRPAERGGTEIMIRYWGPDTDLPIHSHPYNEMFYVLDGEVEMGDTVYKAGACIFIPKGVEYGPTRAPKGGTVLRYTEKRTGPLLERQK